MDRIKTIRNEAESLITKYRDLINSSQVPDRFKHELMNSLVETEKILGEDEIRVAIGGETSSGKTTFLNQFFSTNLFCCSVYYAYLYRQYELLHTSQSRCNTSNRIEENYSTVRVHHIHRLPFYAIVQELQSRVPGR